MTEQQIQQAIRIDLGREPDVVLWRNSTGVAQTKDGRSQRFGLCVGSADIIGIGPGGRFLALEVKTPTGRVSPEQARFIALVNQRGGIGAVVRSPDQARAVIVRARGDV